MAFLMRCSVLIFSGLKWTPMTLTKSASRPANIIDMFHPGAASLVFFVAQL